MGALTLSDWLDKLQLQHPVEIDLGLDRVSQVAAELDLLAAPHDHYSGWYQRQGQRG